MAAVVTVEYRASDVSANGFTASMKAFDSRSDKSGAASHRGSAHAGGLAWASSSGDMTPWFSAQVREVCLR